jgi:hypothetical protein
MPLSKVHSKNLRETLSAIDDCLKAERQLPALVLMYSLIDSLAWAASDQSVAETKIRFESWVSTWLLPHMPKSNPQITPTDLYAARCALIHTGTGISRLSKSKRAKRLLYAWGSAKTTLVERTIVVTGSADEYAVLHCEKFFRAIRKGLKNFVASADNDPQLAARLQDAASVQYDNVLM